MTGPTVPGHLRHDPALDADDLLTATRLHREMRHVTMTTPTPVPSAPQRQASPVPRTPRRWSLASPAGLAAAAVTAVAGVGAVVLVTTVATPSPAWSATPAGASASDREQARQACIPPVGETGTDGKGAPAGDPGVLPPLVVLDVRGDGAVALFADESSTAECVLVRRDGRWERLGSTGGAAAVVTGTAVSLDGFGSTVQPDGTAVSYLNGHIGAGVSSVRLAIPGQEVIVTSVAANRFAVWWPTKLSAPGARLIGLDAAAGEVASVDVDAVLAEKQADDADAKGDPSAPGPKGGKK